MQLKIKMPVDAVVAVTYRCNSRCTMCGIWKIKDFPEMPAVTYKRLPTSLRDINISGGEPFLRSDLVEIIEEIRRAAPRARLVISSNGFLVDVIKKQLPRILEAAPNIELNISVDGFGKMHEKIRGIDGGWHKVLDSLIFAKALLGGKRVKIAFTMTGDNYKDLNKLFEFSKNLGIGFTMALAQSSDFYFGGVKNKLPAAKQKLASALVELNKKFVQGFNPKNWARAYFINGLIDIIKGRRAPLPSYSGQDFFYLDPKGDIYPSVMDNIIMGNISELKDFKEFWFSDEAQSARDKLKGYEVDYWMICTARTAIKRHWQTVAQWIISKKIFNF
ncbi:MAG: radical SAM protein [Candidatus Falkowbacteria bacterium]